MWRVFQATDDPRVHRCARCGFVAAPMCLSPEKLRRQCQGTISATTRTASLADRLRSYGEFRRRWIAAGRPVRSEVEMARLYAI